MSSSRAAVKSTVAQPHSGIAPGYQEDQGKPDVLMWVHHHLGHSFNKYPLSTYCVPNIVLGTRDAEE